MVMAVAAIDSYMHALVLRRVAEVRKAADFPKSLARLDVEFADLTKLADSTIDAQRRGKPMRPWVRVKAALQNRLLKDTFQSYDQVARGLAIAGVNKPWEKIAKELGKSTKDCKSWLNGLVHRRNQIVHEGDLMRASRPRRLKFNSVTHAAAEDDVDRMEELIDAIEKIVNMTA